MSVRDELLTIRDDYGTLTPPIVVEAATPKTHPLHHHFDWDNRAAGHKYRLMQARELIRTVRVEFITPKGDPSSVREFHSVHRPERDRPEYESIENIAVDPIARQTLVHQMRREWANFKARYEHLVEYVELITGEASAAA